MTPAETLRAAAKLLREIAKNAAPGPWGVEYENSKSLSVLSYSGQAFVAFIGVEDAPGVRGDAAWISLVHPGLAEPLAAWLDATAEQYSRSGCEPAMADRALAVARTVLDQPADRGTE